MKLFEVELLCSLHFLFELYGSRLVCDFTSQDYDDHVFGDHGVWQTDIKEKRPDVFTVEFGLHTCVHALLPKKGFAGDQGIISRHYDHIPKLMRSIRTAIERPGVNRTAMVIIVTSGASGLDKGAQVDRCIAKFNRKAAEEAHKQGFAVLERGEIERRLLHKSFGSETPFLVTDTHLEQPAQAVVSTCLLRLMTCLEAEKYDIYSPEIPSLMSIKANSKPSEIPANKWYVLRSLNTLNYVLTCLVDDE